MTYFPLWAWFMVALLVTANIVSFAWREAQFKAELKRRCADFEILLKVLAHDIGNPLNVILTSIESALKDLSQVEEVKRKLLRSQRSTVALVKLLGEVRQMLAMQNGRTPLNLRPVCVKSILQEVIDANAPSLNSKQLKIDSQLPENLSILGDEVLLKSVVLNNIMSNAIKFSKIGTSIKILSQQQKDHVSIEFNDQGVGMPQDVLATLNSKENLISRSGTLGEKGSGFGMLLIKEFTEKMGGEVSITSQLEEDHPTSHGTSVKLKFKAIPMS